MTEEPDNKRRAPRLQHEIPVAYKSVGSFLSDWATNISHGGLFINTRRPLPVGTEVRILIQLPSVEFPVRLTGRVTRVVGGDEPGAEPGQVTGMGIEFTDVDAARREQIETFVRRLRHDLGA